MMQRIGLLVAQLLLLGAGTAGAVLGPAWDGPAVPDGVAPTLAARMALERKELHLANAWHAADRPGGAKRALFHARAALAEAPASGYAWLALAWAERLSGRDDAAGAALGRSWQWAPHSRNLALRRVALAAMYWPGLTMAGRGRLIAEMRLARQSDPVAFGRLLVADPRSAALWRIARGRGLDRGVVPRPPGEHGPRRTF